VTIIDSTEMLRRLRSLVPHGWFGDVAPIRDIVLGGVADALVWVRAQGQVVRAGTRRAGTTGWLLDIDAFGFFGSAFLRRPSESDDAWRKRFTDEIFRPRVTRAAIDKALFDLTGRHPVVHEPWNANDCGAIGVGTIAIAGQAYAPSAASGIGIGASGGLGEGHLHIGQPVGIAPGGFAGAGCVGSTALPYRIFIDAYRPAGRGIPNIPGIGYGGIGSLEIIDDSAIQASVSDSDIYACVARTIAAGVTAWVAIHN